MNIEYIKFSPTGNITVLVKTPVPRSQHAEIAAWLLADPRVGGEQVGYIEIAGAIPSASKSGDEAPFDSAMSYCPQSNGDVKILRFAQDDKFRRCHSERSEESNPYGFRRRTVSDALRPGLRLQMMGGEFCGNATMSFGAMLAREAGLPDGGAMDFLLEVSGSDAPVPCRIVRDGDGWIGTVTMPPPLRVGEFALNDATTVPLVELPGIAHLILPADAGFDEQTLRERLPEWQKRIGCDALGALLWDAGRSYMDPLVYVPTANTLVREHGCGSGSAAIACCLAHHARQTQQIPVHQPGGTITARAVFQKNTLTATTITGRVTVMDEGIVNFS